MRSYVRTICVGACLGMASLLCGCTEMYLIFGPGGVLGSSQTTGSGGTTGGGTTGGGTTTGGTVIGAPAYISDQADPLLEATAGAKVVVAAQMNDDNGDGVIDNNDLVDFVSGSDESQPIQLHLNQGAGVTFSTISIAGGGPIARMVDLEVADFDGDGRPDIAILINDTGFVPVAGASLRGAVVLLFAPADPSNALAWLEVTLTETFLLPSDETGMTSFAVADIDQDVESDGTTPKGPDIVLGTNEEGDGNKNIRLYLNPGRDPAGGTHRSRSGGQWAGSLLDADASSFQSLVLADIDRDGDQDVVATFPTAKSFNVRWLVNPLNPAGVGAVSVAPWTRFIVGQQMGGGDFVDVADLDGDGDTDVGVASVSEGLIQWFKNPDVPADGLNVVTQQTFPWAVYNLGLLQSGFTINQMQLVDMNGDAAVDCFVTADGNMVGMQRGTEVHDFWLAFNILATNPVATIGLCAFEDLNRDGLIDIIAPLDREGLTQDEILIFTRLTP